MRAELAPYSSSYVSRSASLTLHRGDPSYDVVSGASVPVIDLTEFAASVRLTSSKLTVKLAFDEELFDCDYQPRPSDLMRLVVDSTVRAVMTVDAITDFTEARGSRAMTVTCRVRDGLGGWRSAVSASPVFPLGSSYFTMEEVIAGTVMGLNEAEYLFLANNYTVVHSNVQFSSMSPWDMLEEIAKVSQQRPFTDVLNRIRTHSIDTLRTADTTIANDKIVEFSAGSEIGQKLSAVKVGWLDPYLAKQFQVDPVLGSEVLTAGFFKLTVKNEVWFSDDHRQRAEDSYMKIIDTCNNGIIGLSVADEDYRQLDEYHGEIRLTTYWWVPTLYVVSLATLLYLDSVPDGVAGASTVPVGRVLHGSALVVLLGITMSIGTGTYEVWGKPFDLIHAQNHSIISDCSISYHESSREEFETPLITSEDHARGAMTSYLLYRNAENYSVSFTMVDDPRIEVGDVLQFEDGSRILVSDFQNDFSRGAPANIQITGRLL